jgi:hypothetical protein
MTTSRLFFARLLLLLLTASISPLTPFDSGVTSTPISSSKFGRPLKLSGSDSLERVGNDLELDAAKSGHSGYLRRCVMLLTTSLISTRTRSNFSA